MPVGVNWIYAIYNYSDPKIKRLIHNFKYYNKKQIIYDLIDHNISSYINYINKYIEFNLLSSTKHHDIRNIIWIPIPLSPDRLIVRGYNQSELIAKRLISNYNNCYSRLAYSHINLLTRNRSTKKLSHTNSIDERNLMIQDSILIDEDELRKLLMQSDNKHNNNLYVLIDDVTTTGSTLYACRQALIGSGIPGHHIMAITIAH